MKNRGRLGSGRVIQLNSTGPKPLWFFVLTLLSPSLLFRSILLTERLEQASYMLKLPFKWKLYEEVEYVRDVVQLIKT